MKRIISFVAGYTEVNPKWHLRAISMAEERAYLQEIAEKKDLSAEKQTKALAELWITKIAEWSEKSPTKEVDGNEVNYFDDSSGNIAEDVARYFNELDADDAARLANTITLVYQDRLSPDVVF